jgi:protein TonB
VIRPPVVSRPPRPKPSQPAAIPRQEETRPGSPVASSLKANPPPTAPPSIDASWQASVAGWLASHKTYPEDARRDGEQGRVSIRFTIDRSGRVLEASIVSASGYALLDSAAMALVRGASFQSFPASMPQERITITTSIRYTLQ